MTCSSTKELHTKPINLYRTSNHSNDCRVLLLPIDLAALYPALHRLANTDASQLREDLMHPRHVMFVASDDFAAPGVNPGVWLGYMRDDTRRLAHRPARKDLDLLDVHIAQLRFVLNKHICEALHVWCAWLHVSQRFLAVGLTKRLLYHYWNAQDLPMIAFISSVPRSNVCPGKSSRFLPRVRNALSTTALVSGLTTNTDTK